MTGAPTRIVPEPSQGAVTAFMEAAWAAMTPRLYQTNPFRLLGTGVLSSGRDINRRLDQLKLAAELGSTMTEASFAPVPPASSDHLRSAFQSLKDPKQRFFAEVFWFWPESYPDEGADPGTEALGRGATSEAVSFWASAAVNDSVSALHNLSVYHHLMAIEQEQVRPPLAADDVLAWWRAAIRYCQEIAATEGFWKRLRARAEALADPQVPASVVDALRREWPALLAAIHCSLAVRAAEQGVAESAARHIALVGELFADTASARKALERGAEPIVRRIDARIGELRRAVSADPAASVVAAKALIEHCSTDLLCLDTLFGRESEFFAEICTRVGGAALDALVAHQRATEENNACLPLLIALRTLPLNPEAGRRLRETFEVIFANAVGDDLKTNPTPAGADAGEPMYARAYRVIASRTIPPVFLLDVDEPTRRACTGQLADLLKRVARDACADRDDLAFALHAYDTVLQLPSSPAEKQRWEREKEEFRQAFQRRKQKEIQAVLGDHVLELTVRSLRWDDHTFSFEQITGLRYGVVPGPEGEASRAALLVGWATADREVLLDGNNVFRDPAAARAMYDRIVEAVKFFIVPRVVDGLVQRLRRGESLTLGEAVFRSSGVKLPHRSRLWKKEQELPYRSLSHRLEDGYFVVASTENSRLEERCSTAQVWNAAVMGYVIDALAANG